MLPTTTERVHVNTCEAVNEMIRRQTEANVARYVGASYSAISRRLHELDQEWDIERTLETLAPTISLVGLTLGITDNRKWLALPIVVQAFFLQHALQGWCPPVPILRRLGFRTQSEIDHEKYSLKALRGDFQSFPAPTANSSVDVDEVLEAAHP
jgi:hypothetical protein